MNPDTLDKIAAATSFVIAAMIGGMGFNLSVHPIVPHTQARRALLYKVGFAVLTFALFCITMAQTNRAIEQRRAGEAKSDLAEQRATMQRDADTKSTADLRQTIAEMKAELDRAKNVSLAEQERKRRSVQTISSLIASGIPLRETCCCGPTNACTVARHKWEREVEAGLNAIDPSSAVYWRSIVGENQNGTVLVEVSNELQALDKFIRDLK